ncbi:MAG: IS4 family transposase [Bacteroidales bacterium]|nr:IS4 family transposase [Bacteroidales bacterium]
MSQGKMIFGQLMEFGPWDVFKYCVRRYNGDYKNRGLTCWKQFLCMAFGQLTHRESLSDTTLCLKLHKDKLYHLGIGQPFSKSTLSRANENRDWRIFRDFALKLIEYARNLCKNDNLIDVKLKGKVYALDATVVDLCLDVFWWAKFRKKKGAIKLHTLLDLKTAIPEYIFITDGSVHEVNTLDYISFPAGSYLVMDKAYIDFARLSRLASERTTFVVRSKENMKYRVLKSRITDKNTGVLCDQTIVLTGNLTSKKYPENLRRVQYYDSETDNTLVFLCNNFKISALTIAALYRNRWGIELFFKWIKQHLKIQTFWGHSENAVKTQVWIAISTYVLVVIAKKRFNLTQSLYEILQMISLSAFDRTPMKLLFSNENYQDVKEQNCNQLILF